MNIPCEVIANYPDIKVMHTTDGMLKIQWETAKGNAKSIYVAPWILDEPDALLSTMQTFECDAGTPLN